KSDVTSEIGNHLHRAETVKLSDSLLRVNYLIRQQGFGIVAVTDDEGAIVGVIDDMGLANFVRLTERRKP
ncbi:MAG: hypothetical protein JNJ57_15480, partial [Saprospiraceae bacterium]|nr:hypothetical protein [Saprospiraceae bacterium]